ncbi:MAG TPA: hypothetical protein VF981_11165 [Gemmatimonadaceae bacterium]
MLSKAIPAVATLGLCLALGADPVAAQQVPVTPGSRVRVSASSLVAPLVANFLEQRGDTLVFIEDGTGRHVWTFALDQVVKLETTAGETAVSRPWVLKGAAIGGGAGLVSGLVFAASVSPSNEDRRYNKPATALVGAAIGAGIGALIGSRHKLERWTQVQLPRGLSLAPDFRGGIVVSLRYR